MEEGALREWRSKIIDAGRELSTVDSEYLGKRKCFTDLVKDAVGAGVAIDLIKAWGDEAGVQRQTTNRALRLAGIRQRAERSDKGVPKNPEPEPAPTPMPTPENPSEPPAELDPEVWAEKLLAAKGGDRVAACDFLDSMVTYIAEKKDQEAA